MRKISLCLTNGVGVVLIINFLWGVPRFAVQNGVSCSTCHANPAGSGIRNEYGINIFSMDELPMIKGMKFTDESYSSIINDHLRIGADFRFQAMVYSQGDTLEKTAFFPMQADIYGHLIVNKIIEINFTQDLVRSYPNFWTLLNIFPNNGYLRFGRHIPTYGFRLDDHTSYIRGGNIRRIKGLSREGMPFSPFNPTPGIMEIGIKLYDTFFTASIANGYALGREPGYGFFESLADKNFTARLEYSKSFGKVNGMWGGSVMKEQDFILKGIFGGLALGKITWMGEIDLAENWIEDGITSLASYSEFILNPIQGVSLIAKLDFFDEDTDQLKNALTRITGGIEFFPFSFLEIKAQVRLTSLSNSNDKTNRDYIIQFHSWF